MNSTPREKPLFQGGRRRPTEENSFIQPTQPTPILPEDKPEAYARLAREAAQGELPGSSAGGEQPKFTAYAQTPDGPRHVIVKFSEAGRGPWPELVQRLATDRHLQPAAAHNAARLWAFGTLIGNTDMHSGNLSFITDQGRPYTLAPAYDMTPMAFAPRSSGSLPDTLPAANIHASVSNGIWREAETLARDFVVQVRAAEGFSARFVGCVDALAAHGETAGGRIGRLG